MELLEFLELSRFFGKVQQVTGKHCPVKLLTFGQSNKKDLKARNSLQCNQGSSLWPIDIKGPPFQKSSGCRLTLRPWGVRTLDTELPYY